MGFALTPGEAPLHFSRSKNVMHVGITIPYYSGLLWFLGWQASLMIRLRGE